MIRSLIIALSIRVDTLCQASFLLSVYIVQTTRILRLLVLDEEASPIGGRVAWCRSAGRCHLPGDGGGGDG